MKTAALWVNEKGMVRFATEQFVKAIQNDAEQSGFERGVREIEKAALVSVQSLQAYGTPGKLICVRCALCGSECQSGQEMAHDTDCVFSLLTKPKETEQLDGGCP